MFVKADEWVHKYSIDTKQLNTHFEHQDPLKTNTTVITATTTEREIHQTVNRNFTVFKSAAAPELLNMEEAAVCEQSGWRHVTISQQMTVTLR